MEEPWVHPSRPVSENYQRMYRLVEGTLPNAVGGSLAAVVGLIVWVTHGNPPQGPIIFLSLSIIPVGLGLLLRQWHRRRDAEDYLREDYQSYLRLTDTSIAVPVERRYLTCRIFGHRHPDHDQPT